MELALAQESAEQNTAQLQTPSQTTTQVNKLGGHPNPKASNGKRSFETCHWCGGKHMQKDCPFKEAECHKCKKKGHLARVCHYKTKQTQSNAAPRQARAQNSTHHMEEIETTDEQSKYTLFIVTTNACKLLKVTVKVNNIDLTMEVDTGASMSLIIGNATFQKLWPAQSCPMLLPYETKLHTYTGEQIDVLGTISTNVKFKQQQETLPLLVVKGDGPIAC